jgi:uncharacterized membrane protein
MQTEIFMENRQEHAPAAPSAERLISLVGGGLLVLIGVRRRGPTGLLMGVVGGTMIARGMAGHFGVAEALGALPEERDKPIWDRWIKVRKAITIMKPREEVFDFWRNFENLPKFMKHLQAVEILDERRSKWTAKAPAGQDVSWEAEVVREEPGISVSWRSIPGSGIENSGEVVFKDAPGGRGTEVHVELLYHPPAGVLGVVVAKMFGEEPDGQVQDDLNRLKALLEVGHVPTNRGQPSDRMRQARGWANTVWSEKEADRLELMQ